MIRRCASLFALAASSLFFVGCAASTEEEEEEEEIVSDTSAAATADCDPFSDTCDNTVDYTSGSFAFTMTTIAYASNGELWALGYNAKGQQLSARFTSATAFRQANLNTYPTDPLFPVDPVKVYNDAALTGDYATISSSLLGLSGGVYKARFWIDKKTKTIRAFRPVY